MCFLPKLWPHLGTNRFEILGIRAKVPVVVLYRAIFSKNAFLSMFQKICTIASFYLFQLFWTIKTRQVGFSLYRGQPQKLLNELPKFQSDLSLNEVTVLVRVKNTKSLSATCFKYILYGNILPLNSIRYILIYNLNFDNSWTAKARRLAK